MSRSKTGYRNSEVMRRPATDRDVTNAITCKALGGTFSGYAKAWRVNYASLRDKLREYHDKN